MDITSTHIEVSGHSLFVKSIVSEKLVSEVPLILLHDALGSVAQWGDFPEKVALNCNCPVVVYDRPLHGNSTSVSYGSIKAQFESEGDLLQEVVGKLDIDRPGLIGVSDGATISLNYAASYPTSFVVAMAPHVIMEDKIITGISRWMQRREEFEKKLVNFHGDQTVALIDQWYDLWQKADKEGWDMTMKLNDITCPVHIIQDPDDPYGSVDQVAAVLNRIIGSKPHLIKGAGHFPYLSFPERVINIIESMLVA